MCGGRGTGERKKRKPGNLVSFSTLIGIFPRSRFRSEKKTKNKKQQHTAGENGCTLSLK